MSFLNLDERFQRYLYFSAPKRRFWNGTKNKILMFFVVFWGEILITLSNIAQFSKRKASFTGNTFYMAKK